MWFVESILCVPVYGVRVCDVKCVELVWRVCHNNKHLMHCLTRSM